MFAKCLLMVFGVIFSLSAQAQYDPMGQTLLRAMATNVNGAGIRVAQAEAAQDSPGSFTKWEVNPANVGQPVSLFTYYSSNGMATTFPNSLGVDSGHADSVGYNFYAIPTGVATNVAHVDNYEADYFLTAYIESLTQPGLNAAVVNQSFTFGPLTVADQQIIDSDYDNYSDRNGTLFVSAANNYGNFTNVCAPGTAYNCISVGAYANGTFANSIGPTADNGRCKPDITAPNGATSFSTPQVAGAAAALMQAALRGDGGSDTNSAFDMRSIKALLLNGAVKPLGWTNSTSSPLDARYGAGVLNVFNSYEQLAGGQHGYIVSTTVSAGGAHPPTGASGTVAALSGWDFNTNSSGIHSDTVNHYYFDATNDSGGTKFTATATLVWNRQLNQSSINNLNLFLYNCANSNLVACSTSLVDNVEHIFVPALPPGRYDLQVWKAGGIPGVDANVVSAAEPYALAWAFVVPTASIAGTNAVLTWPVYPAGYLAEASTNLAGGSWSTNALPAPVLTNGCNNIVLNPTNALRFFRLRSPNF
jgi:hypothetical protein